MKRALLMTLGVGVGWVIGVVVSMILMPIGGQVNYQLGEAIGNTFVFGFPGFVLMAIAIVLAMRDDMEENPYAGEF